MWWFQACFRRIVFRLEPPKVVPFPSRNPCGSFLKVGPQMVSVFFVVSFKPQKRGCHEKDAPPSWFYGDQASVKLSIRANLAPPPPLPPHHKKAAPSCCPAMASSVADTSRALLFLSAAWWILWSLTCDAWRYVSCHVLLLRCLVAHVALW